MFTQPCMVVRHWYSLGEMVLYLHLQSCAVMSCVLEYHVCVLIGRDTVWNQEGTTNVVSQPAHFIITCFSCRADIASGHY